MDKTSSKLIDMNGLLYNYLCQNIWKGEMIIECGNNTIAFL